ncbi:MAG: crossover junction endodeoxyribonuclease RuvC [Clostridia bacterium]|nr:crossover junction endodeoxyribonuclease RuvC [Clostridia bacterium]MBQ7224467.1 crossover junction endodeoxyribonuclease RuvC [Clostridia bacterium]
MIILGIDPGYGTIGYGVIEKNGSKITPVDYGVIQTPKDESIATRLAMIYDSLNILIKKYKPDEIAVEELFFNTNITTGIKVAQARGVILLCAVRECGRLYEYTPLMVKQSLTGNGRADKKQVQYMVKMMLKLKTEPRPDDAADALAIAICHANTCGFNQRVLN